MNETQEHTANVSVEDMLWLLEEQNSEPRRKYYERILRTEHMHDFHYLTVADHRTHPSHARDSSRVR